MNEVTEEDILAGLDIHPFTKILYAMFLNQCNSLALLRANGLWRDSPKELIQTSEAKALAYAKARSSIRAELNWEAELWRGADILCAKLYDAGGLCFGTADIARFAKVRSVQSINFRNRANRQHKCKQAKKSTKKGAAA